jgi:cytochrome c peroxidase
MFTDGLKLAVGAGVGDRHTPSLVGLSYSPWFYWDGRKDSQWAQALAPLEAKHEHATTRSDLARLIKSDANYASLYEAAFGNLPKFEIPANASPLGDDSERAAWLSLSDDEQHSISKVFANIGKSLAAYQRKLLPGRARFDDYAERMLGDDSAKVNQGDVLSAAELQGLRLFIGKAMCVTCHNGPLFTNHEFHNTGVLANPGELPSMARYDGIRTARLDPFNCLGEFSDAENSECIELRFARDTNDLVGAHKTPTLRNVDLTAPYMHGGQITDLAAVMRHYNEAPTSMLSHNEAKPLGLRPPELRALEAFMHTLTAPLATDPRWLKAP